jgi:selenocysteine-specific translation elongation factor
MREKNLIKSQTEKKIEKILLKLNESWNINSPFMILEQGLIELHKRIGQLNRKIKNSTE